MRRLSPLLTTTHDISRPSAHSRPTNHQSDIVSPGQRVLTTSFATRRSRVQIPSAPPFSLVRAISASAPRNQTRRSEVPRSTEGPQDSTCYPLVYCEGSEQAAAQA